MRRIAFCWSTISGYMAACWKALQARDDAEVFVLATLPDGRESDFDPKPLLGNIPSRMLTKSESHDLTTVKTALDEFEPDTLITAGWMNTAYIQLALSPAYHDALVLMGMDNPRRPGSFRQFAARYKLSRYLRRVDGALVTGERAWQFAHHLGIPAAAIRRGVYGVDVASLAPILKQRQAAAWPERFLYLGQLSERKGLPTLLEAYRRYRDQTENPWPLRLCGIGPLSDLANGEGIELMGFVQPGDLPRHMLEAGVFVLPSLYDAWPLAIVEAAAAGLPVICSEACGSGIELVRPYFNGIVTATGDPTSLASAFQWTHNNAARLPDMGERSATFGAAYSADVWAERIIEAVNDAEARRRSGPRETATWSWDKNS